MAAKDGNNAGNGEDSADREEDFSFADFVGVSGAPERPQTAPPSDATQEAESAPELTARERSRILERETGFEPATLSLGS